MEKKSPAELREEQEARRAQHESRREGHRRNRYEREIPVQEPAVATDEVESPTSIPPVDK